MDLQTHPIFALFSSEMITEKSFNGESFYLIQIKEKNVNVLMTNGLSEIEMNTTEKSKDKRYIELFFCIPNYWEIDELEASEYNWVYTWLSKLKEYIKTKNQWIGDGHTIYCGDSHCYLSSDLKLNHLFVIDPILLENELPPVEKNNKKIHFLSVLPIFGDEMDYKQGKGTLKLKRKLLKQGVTEKLDEYRQSSLKNRWKFYR